MALILVGAALLHRRALGVPFFADDYLFLEQARGRSLLAALLAPDAIGNFFRPVSRQLFFWVVGHLAGESARAFHAVNLGLFLGVVASLHAVARRLAGGVAAAAAAAFIALHYSADVAVRWASGDQDLLAVLGALAAIALYLGGRRAWAAVALLAALLSKESVILTAAVAAVAGRRPAEPWRATLTRAWPLGLATAIWAALWLITAPRRPALGGSLGFEPLGAAAVLAHLPHVAAGVEWRAGLAMVWSAVPPLLPLAAVAIAVLVASQDGGTGTAARRDAEAAPAVARREGARARDRGRGAIVTGAVWALAAVAPVAAVASIWSAYYYLYALCGVAAMASRGGSGEVMVSLGYLGMGPSPVRVDLPPMPEADLGGPPLEDAVAEATGAALAPMEDLHATATYRRWLARRLGTRAARAAAAAGSTEVDA